MTGRGLVTTLLVIAVLFGFGSYLARRIVDEAPARGLTGRCHVLGERRVHLDAEQMSNAATIAAVGIRRNVGERGIVVALAAALQESKLRNLAHLGHRNDHDSIGLFQQRPSQGWGTEEQIMDQRYAAERFYAALARIKGWEKMRVTEAAQRVQRSAYPEAYQKWADEAQTLASAFTGRAKGVVNCDTDAQPQHAGPAAIEATGELLRLDFGRKTPDLINEKDLLRVPVGDPATGWQFAHWLVAQAETTGVAKVTFGNRQWSWEAGEWAETEPANAAAEVVAEVAVAR